MNASVKPEPGPKAHSLVFPLVSGVIFAVGLALSGMAQPEKVIGFLDVTGDWDPTLAFVMGGGIAIYLPLHRLILRRPTPLCGPKYHLPVSTDLDARLLLGSALFGVGWGLAGYCPGPALLSLGSLSTDVLLFVGAMLLGMVLHGAVGRLGNSTHSNTANPSA